MDKTIHRVVAESSKRRQQHEICPKETDMWYLFLLDNIDMDAKEL
jgi:hypothetical protein